MNGKIAKRLRQLAVDLLATQGFSAGEFHNQYDQESNCISWEPAYEDGHRHVFDVDEEVDPFANLRHPRAKDPDGKELLGMFKNPGTLHCKQRGRVVYHALKKLWKETGGKHKVFTSDEMQSLRRESLRDLPQANEGEN